MRICSFSHCSNSTYRLNRWLKQCCSVHSVDHGKCPCPQPFKLFPFPSEKKDPYHRLEWIKAVYRLDTSTGKNWCPGPDDRVCSAHFVDGLPTAHHPNPTINLGHKGNVTIQIENLVVISKCTMVIINRCNLAFNKYTLLIINERILAYQSGNITVDSIIYNVVLPWPLQ